MNYFGNTGVADGGLGSLLRDQVSTESDDERRRRLQQLQERQRLGGGVGLNEMLAGVTSGGGVGRY